MEFSRFLVGLLLLVAIVFYADAKRSFGSFGSRRSGGSSSRGTVQPRRPQTTRAKSEAQKGQEYRDWATKLTGAGDHHRPVVTSGNTAQKKPGSSTGDYGWNVGKQQSQPSQVGTKPAVSDSATKTSATNVQSGYNPSGGYNRQPAQNPAYGQSTGNQYNPSGQGYNPSGHGYNPSGSHPYGAPPAYNPGAPPPYSPHAQSYHPNYNSHQNPPAYSSQPYNPYGSSYGGHSPYSVAPGAGYNPPVGHAPQTILVQGSSSRPGIGQLAKEAFVFAGVSAGVNAAVNRILPGGIYGHSHSSSSNSNSNPIPVASGPVNHTSITYNYYYNNGTADGAPPPGAPVPPGVPVPPANPAAPAAPAPSETPASASSAAPSNAAPAPTPTPGSSDPQDILARENPSPLGFVITKAELTKFSEDLFSKETNNAFKFITINVQGQKRDDSVTDDAPEPLLTVKDEAYELPTIKAVLALHDNYELDVKTKEEVTSEERKEENELLDKFLETDIMKNTMKYLAEKGYVPNDEYEFKDTLKRIWFSQFKRIDGEPSSSGFETVFLAELFEKEVIGLHNWIYLAKQEAAKKANYLGYIKQSSLGSGGAIVKLRLTLNDVVQPVTSIFVGTSPELELALYTVCFYTRPNAPCPVSIGGTEFLIIANRVNYFGKDILVSAYPEI